MRTVALLGILLICRGAAPEGVRAQTGPRGARNAGSARAAMHAFGAAIAGEGRRRLASYFPARGDWTWTRTIHLPSGDRVGVWRFRGADLAVATEACGPLSNAFLFNREPQPAGPLASWTGPGPRSWRAAGRNVFVPVGSPELREDDEDLLPATFVQWRRERGRWVIAAVGEESFAWPPAPDTVPDDVSRELPSPAPAAPVYAGAQMWFINNEPLRFGGHLYTKYDVPRTAGRLAEVGWLGQIRVYAERGRERSPIVLYFPVGDDLYQKYQSETADGCP